MSLPSTTVPAVRIVVPAIGVNVVPGGTPVVLACGNDVPVPVGEGVFDGDGVVDDGEGVFGDDVAVGVALGDADALLEALEEGVDGVPPGSQSRVNPPLVLSTFVQLNPFSVTVSA